MVSVTVMRQASRFHSLSVVNGKHFKSVRRRLGTTFGPAVGTRKTSVRLLSSIREPFVVRGYTDPFLTKHLVLRLKPVIQFVSFPAAVAFVNFIGANTNFVLDDRLNRPCRREQCIGTHRTILLKGIRIR